MSQSKVILVFVSVALFGVMHFAKDYRPFKLKSPLDISENVENLRNLYRMANDMAAKESIDSSHLDHIIDSLIEFLKLHQTNDVIREKVIELVTIFQRAIQIKAKIFQRLKRILLMIRVLKTIPNGTLNRIHEQFVCLERFTSCINLDMVAKKLASPRVEVIIGVIETLLPDIKIYATELDACVNVSETT